MNKKVCLLFLSLFLWQASARGDDSGVFPLDDMISTIKREIGAAESVVIGEPRFTLVEVVIDLAVSNMTDKKGNLSLGVPFYDAKVSGGISRVEQNTSKLTIKLLPPKPITMSEGAQLGEFPIARYIVEARKQLQRGLKDPPYLDPQTLTINMEVAVTRKVEGDAGVKLFIVSIGGKSGHSSADTSTIKLTFNRAKP